MYNNEKQTGSAINAFLASPSNSGKLARKDIFYTSKLSSNTTYDSARKSISQSVKVCGLGYIDLFLLHSPYGGKQMRLESWRAVEDAIEAGEVRSGGVSNYGVKHVCCLALETILLLRFCSCKSFWPPNRASNQRLIKWKSIPLTPNGKSCLSVRPTASL